MTKELTSVTSLPVAWVMLAIFYGRGEQGASLRDILSAGDYLNHAVLTYEALRGALAWLQAAHCVEARDGRYYPSGRVLAAYQSIERKHRSASKQWDRLEEFLQTQSLQADVPGPAISLDAYNRAVESYIG